MTKRTWPMRTFARAAAAVATTTAVVLLTACGSSSGDAAAGGETSAHAGHDASAPVPTAQPLRPGERFLDLTVSKPTGRHLPTVAPTTTAAS